MRSKDIDQWTALLLELVVGIVVVVLMVGYDDDGGGVGLVVMMVKMIIMRMTLHISAGRLGSPFVSLSYLASPRQKRRNAVCLQVRLYLEQFKNMIIFVV